MEADHFSNFFAFHNTLLDKNSKVRESQTYITDSNLSSLQFKDNKIIKITWLLDTKKVYGYDDISISMLKMSDLTIMKPLSIISRNCINPSKFPDIW